MKLIDINDLATEVEEYGVSNKKTLRARINSGYFKKDLHYVKVNGNYGFTQEAIDKIKTDYEITVEYPFTMNQIAKLIEVNNIHPARINRKLHPDTYTKYSKGHRYNKQALNRIAMIKHVDLYEMFCYDINDFRKIKPDLEQKKLDKFIRENESLEIDNEIRYKKSVMRRFKRKVKVQKVKENAGEFVWSRLSNQEKLKCKNTLGLSEDFYKLIA